MPRLAPLPDEQIPDAAKPMDRRIRSLPESDEQEDDKVQRLVLGGAFASASSDISISGSAIALIVRA